MLRGSHGEVAGAESGASFVKRSQVNVGTIPVLPPGHAASVDSRGWIRRRPIGSGWGGAAVVVAGVTTCLGDRESRSQGQGRQRS